jgi:hypothetical protein
VAGGNKGLCPYPACRKTPTLQELGVKSGSTRLCVRDQGRPFRGRLLCFLEMAFATRDPPANSHLTSSLDSPLSPILGAVYLVHLATSTRFFPSRRFRLTVDDRDDGVSTSLRHCIGLSPWHGFHFSFPSLLSSDHYLPCRGVLSPATPGQQPEPPFPSPPLKSVEQRYVIVSCTSLMSHIVFSHEGRRLESSPLAESCLVALRTPSNLKVMLFLSQQEFQLRRPGVQSKALNSARQPVVCCAENASQRLDMLSPVRTSVRPISK